VFSWNRLTRSNWRFAIYFFAIFFLWWLVPQLLRHGVRDVFQELQAPIWYGADYLHQIKSYWHLQAQPKEVLARQIVELSRQLACCKLQQLTEQNSQAMEEKISKDFSPFPSFRNIFCRVLRRDEKSWWCELAIRGGKDRGIGENMALVTAHGLVGKILHVYRHHCIAILASDPRFRAVVHLRGDTRPLLLQGAFQTGFSTPIGHLSCIPLDVSIPPNGSLEIVTSSLSGIYAEGIPIGTINNLKLNGSGAFQEGIVTLNREILSVREVAVLAPTTLLCDE
jgi:rod shape-determining protein MreC